MPGKYSHTVVLAHYSMRGIISLPEDQHYAYLKTIPPAPSSPMTASRIHATSSAVSQRWSMPVPSTHPPWNLSGKASAQYAGAIQSVPNHKKRQMIIDSEGEDDQRKPPAKVVEIQQPRQQSKARPHVDRPLRSCPSTSAHRSPLLMPDDRSPLQCRNDAIEANPRFASRKMEPMAVGLLSSRNESRAYSQFQHAADGQRQHPAAGDHTESRVPMSLHAPMPETDRRLLSSSSHPTPRWPELQRLAGTSQPEPSAMSTPKAKVRHLAPEGDGWRVGDYFTNQREEQRASNRALNGAKYAPLPGSNFEAGGQHDACQIMRESISPVVDKMEECFQTQSRDDVNLDNLSEKGRSSPSARLSPCHTEIVSALEREDWPSRARHVRSVECLTQQRSKVWTRIQPGGIDRNDSRIELGPDFQRRLVVHGCHGFGHGDAIAKGRDLYSAQQHSPSPSHPGTGKAGTSASRGIPSRRNDGFSSLSVSLSSLSSPSDGDFAVPSLACHTTPRTLHIAVDDDEQEEFHRDSQSESRSQSEIHATATDMEFGHEWFENSFFDWIDGLTGTSNVGLEFGRVSVAGSRSRSGMRVAQHWGLTGEISPLSALSDGENDDFDTTAAACPPDIERFKCAKSDRNGEARITTAVELEHTRARRERGRGRSMSRDQRHTPCQKSRRHQGALWFSRLRSGKGRWI